MTKEEIFAGESESLEFKVDVSPKTISWMKTIVAFANGNGRRIVFGVSDAPVEIVGFDGAEIFQKIDAITNAIVDSCEPKIYPRVTTQIVDGKNIIIVEISAGMDRPYFIRSQGQVDGVYIRVAATTRRCGLSFVREMIQDGEGFSYDQRKTKRELSEDEIDAFCNRLYRHALENVSSDASKADVKRIGRSQLMAWKLIREEDGRTYASIGYQLLDGRLDECPDAWIQCAVFRGTTRSIFVTKRDIKGPIDEQVEEARDFVLEHINVGGRLHGMAMQNVYELPLFSIREMIANAVCHRSYIQDGKIQVAIYDDRLEVTTPRKLDRDLTLDRMKRGVSKIWNRGIAEVFSYLHLVEAWGSGMPRIYQEAREYGLREPELIDLDGWVRMNLYRKPFAFDANGVVSPASFVNETDETNHATESETDETKYATNEIEQKKKQLQTLEVASLEEREKQILETLKHCPNATQVQLSEKLHISIGTLKRIMPKLREKGFLKRKGSNRSGYWEVSE